MSAYGTRCTADPSCRREPAGVDGRCDTHEVRPDGPLGPVRVSYRQLDYWTRIRLLRPENPDPGTGRARDWPDAELAVAAMIARLTDAGLELRVAARVAREQAGRLDGRAVLRGGIVLRL